MKIPRSFVPIWLAIAQMAAVAATASEKIPVLSEEPGCRYERLGRVSSHAGWHTDELRRPRFVSAGSYRHAFAELAEAGKVKGANAVILRWHEPTHFKGVSHRDAKPNYFRLLGAAIRLPADNSLCRIAVVDPVKFFNDRYSPGAR